MPQAWVCWWACWWLVASPLRVLKSLAANLVAAVQTRLALLANEIQTEKQLVLRQLALGLGLFFFLGLGVLITVALAVALWWEARLWILAGFGGLFWGLAGYLYATLRRSHARATPPFSSSLAELHEDLRQLRAAAQVPPP